MYVYIHRAHAREAANANRWFSFVALNKMVAALRDWLDVHNIKKNRPRGRGKKGKRLAAKLFMDAADPEGSAFRLYSHPAARDPLWQFYFLAEITRLITEQPDIDR
jgi:hypothetical protein